MTRTTSGSPAGAKRLSIVLKKIPRTVFGGRVRTTTLLLIAVFIGLMFAYGQATAHYQKADDEKAQRTATERLRRSAQDARDVQSEQDQLTTTTTRTLPATTHSSGSSSSAAPSGTDVPGVSGAPGASTVPSESPAPYTLQLPGGASVEVPHIP